jgi:hypothetical protein
MKRHQDKMSDSPLASNRRLEKRRRHPTVFYPFQRKFFTVVLHL